MKSKTVWEGNDSISQDESGSCGRTMEEMYRVFAEELNKYFDRKTSHFDPSFDESKEKNKNNQRLAGLQYQAQQPNLPVEADIKPDTKTQKLLEGAAADDDKYGDTSSARVDDDSIRLTSFGDQEFSNPLLAPKKSIGDALANEGAAVPKPHFPPVEVSMLTSAAGGFCSLHSLYNA